LQNPHANDPDPPPTSTFYSFAPPADAAERARKESATIPAAITAMDLFVAAWVKRGTTSMLPLVERKMW
jgi:hypothetical protein